MTDELDDIRRTLGETREQLLARPNVVATGVGFKEVQGRRTSELAIVCSVTTKVPASRLARAELVPQVVGGVPTDVMATGPIRALAPAGGDAGVDHDRTARLRPAPGGAGVGHRDISAGTLGCLVHDRDDPDAVLLLSNNHVLAHGDSAAPGDPILQPAPFDGGRDPEDRIATLERYVPVVMSEQPSECALAGSAARLINALAAVMGSGSRLRVVSSASADNLVDAALARPLEPGLVTDDILGLGTPTGVARAELGTSVTKSGRTTGVTASEIVQVDVTASVLYGSESARFTDQLMAGAMSRGGDSGSVVLDGEHRVVGLLFAGSDRTTLINRIEHVFDALGVVL